jgi:virginiamycin A acetyltransferase
MSIRRWLRRRLNPDNLTRLHLAALVRKGHATIGDHSYGAPKIRFPDGARLEIGRFCSFADQVEIFLGGNHRLDFVATYPFDYFSRNWPGSEAIPSNVSSRGDVKIGSDVWIGSGARILSGVTIGHGVAIGAGAVVSRDVPPYGIVAGNPANMTRMRFSEAIVAALLETHWWDLPDATINSLAPLLQSPDVNALLDAVRAIRTRETRP